MKILTYKVPIFVMSKQITECIETLNGMPNTKAVLIDKGWTEREIEITFEKPISDNEILGIGSLMGMKLYERS